MYITNIKSESTGVDSATVDAECSAYHSNAVKETGQIAKFLPAGSPVTHPVLIKQPSDAKHRSVVAADGGSSNGCVKTRLSLGAEGRGSRCSGKCWEPVADLEAVVRLGACCKTPPTSDSYAESRPRLWTARRPAAE